MSNFPQDQELTSIENIEIKNSFVQLGTTIIVICYRLGTRQGQSRKCHLGVGYQVKVHQNLCELPLLLDMLKTNCLNI